MVVGGDRLWLADGDTLMNDAQLIFFSTFEGHFSDC